MQTDLIIISEYCRNCDIDPTFIFSLEEGGLIQIYVVEGEPYLHLSQLKDVERFIRMHYDLSINIPGIETIEHMQTRMRALQQEINHLKSRLKLYEGKKNSNPDELPEE
ncbi:MAG: chaperone modulator CbpM [Tannerellaceae bacterium]|nr:chaperone modulator CbpM [Tannerellaceae bacterium]